MNNVSLFLLLFFLCFFLGNAQETTIRHTVSKGETVFQLSRTYKVSPQEIFDLNPSSVDVIKIGEVLLIPKNEYQQNTGASTANNSASTTITYAVLSGDTKFSLARNYGITVEELEQQNPHTKNGLQAGHILKINGQQVGKTLNTNYTIKETHLVLKGETLWGISKANGLTVAQLVNANSDSLTGILQIGQVLQIPMPTATESNGTYLVQRGDTKFGLSKKYGVTIGELEQANPEIVRLLMAGQTIRIPGVTQVAPNEDVVDNDTNVEETPKQEEIIQQTTAIETIEVPNQNTEIKTTSDSETSATAAFEEYEIQPQETLYGLSKKAGMSISDFVSLNPQLTNGAKVGMIVKMPSTRSSQTPSSGAIETPIETSNQRYVDLSRSINTEKQNQVLLFLPFSESQFDAEYRQSSNFKDVSDEFVRNHLEFYRGAKIAQDSARALGLDVTIQIVETNTSKKNTKATDVAKEISFENYDAIMAPFYENDIAGIASLDRNKTIPVVTTTSVLEEQGLKNIYNAIPNLNSKRNTMLDYMTSKGGNLIVICDVDRKESRTYISNYAPTTIFIEANKRGTFNTDELVSQLDKTKVNYVILESEKKGVFLSTTNVLLGQLSDYAIQLALLDETLIPSTDEVSDKRFIILQMLYPSISSINESALSTNVMEAFQKVYGVAPSQHVKYGFDMMFDTLLRLSQSKSFEESATTEASEYTSLKMEYKMNVMGQYENKGIYILQYNSDGSLKEIK